MSLTRTSLRYPPELVLLSPARLFANRVWEGSYHKRQKPQAPIPNRQTIKVANVKVRNRYTNLTYMMIGLPII